MVSPITSSAAAAAAVDDSTTTANAPRHDQQISDGEILDPKSSDHSIVLAPSCSKRAQHGGEKEPIREILTHDDNYCNEEGKKPAFPSASEDSTTSTSSGAAMKINRNCPSSPIDLTDVPPQPPIPIIAGSKEGGSSKYAGISFIKSLNKWMAHILIDGKIQIIGVYDHEEAAAVDYARAVHKYKKPLWQEIVTEEGKEVTPEKPTTMLHPKKGSTAPLQPPHHGNNNPPTDASKKMVSAPRARACKILKKPKRPLTAYHIYFQIEREFIIQTTAGEDVDKSIHEGKIFLNDVPERYKAIKLSPDWYHGPGKRTKRKHRKQHGKIGFHELSRVVSERWATLEETHPDIKHFVTKLANKVNEEYKRELKVYRENLTKNMIAPTAIPKTKSSASMTQQPSLHHQEVAGVMALQQMMASQQTHPSISAFPYHIGIHPNQGRFAMNPPAQLNQQVNQLQLAYAYAHQQRARMWWGKPQPKEAFDYDYYISQIDNSNSTEKHPPSNHSDKTQK